MSDDEYPYEPERDYQRGEESHSAAQPEREYQRDYQREEPAPAPPEKMGFEQAGGKAAVTLGDDLWELHAATARLLEFTAGRTQPDFIDSELLQAAADSLLRLAQAAAQRIAMEAPAVAAKLDRVSALDALFPGPEKPPAQRLWQYIQDDLQALHASAAAELETWHSG